MFNRNVVSMGPPTGPTYIKGSRYIHNSVVSKGAIPSDGP